MLYAHLPQKENKLGGESIEPKEGVVTGCIGRVVISLISCLHTQHISEHCIDRYLKTSHHILLNLRSKIAT